MVDIVTGQHHKFMLLPPTPEETTWLPAGPVTFAVEARVFGTEAGEVIDRGVSLHVYDADRRQEWLRFDSFDLGPHYHYIHQVEGSGDPMAGSNVVWGYDRDVNGDLLTWAIAAIRARLPAMLRKAGATRLAAEVEQGGYDQSVLAEVETAAARAYDRTVPGTDMIAPSNTLMANWKRIHPQFNTADY